MKALHPGQILKTEWIGQTSITINTFSKKSGLSIDYLERLIAGRVSLSEHAALSMAKGTGLSSQYWLNVQMRFDNGESK
jgi:addiction module HigA family antidote